MRDDPGTRLSFVAFIFLHYEVLFAHSNSTTAKGPLVKLFWGCLNLSFTCVIKETFIYRSKVLMPFLPLLFCSFIQDIMQNSSFKSLNVSLMFWLQWRHDNEYSIMNVKKILPCGFFQNVCGVKHERIGLAHGENELTVAVHGCRKR